MPHILTVDLTVQRLADYGGIAPRPPATESENVATLWVDWDAKKWECRTEKQAWLARFGVGQGVITTYHGFLIGEADQMLAYPSGGDLMVLRNFGLNAQAKLAGIALFGPNPNAVDTMMGGVANPFLNFTYFWRKVRGQDMTRRERIEEMYAIVGNKFSGQIASDAIHQIRDLATAESLGKIGAILAIFAYSAAMGYAAFIAALRVLCGVADVATNWAMYGPYWDTFMQQVNSGTDLNYGAEALANLLGGLLGYIGSNAIAAKATSSVAKPMQRGANKFADAVRNNSPARWKAAAEAGVKEHKRLAEESGDPNNTKKDPATDITASERAAIKEHQSELVARVRDLANKFGFPAHIAEGYAMLAFRNGWTIIARTSKKASIPHHLLGEENVTGKSLYVQYKIDSEHGVIIKKPGMDIKNDFYSPDSYAAKQLEAIYYAENPNAPKGSFKITEGVLQEFRSKHVFEFRSVKMGYNEQQVLFHNGKMVIGDIDLMGIYVKCGHDLVPLPQWMIHNDAAFLQDFVNRNVGGVKSSFHGQQDVGRNSKGLPFRSPDAGENYAMFTPDLKLTEVKNTAALEATYRTLHVHWPYETYTTIRGAVTHWVIATARKHPAPKAQLQSTH